MKYLAIAVTTAGALLLANTGFAQTSSNAEFRGFQQCVDAIDRTSRGLVPARTYYIAKAGASAEYFINATRWENGEREAVRIACTTTNRGQRLLSADVEAGRYVNDAAPSVRVEVAQN